MARGTILLSMAAAAIAACAPALSAAPRFTATAGHPATVPLDPIASGAAGEAVVVSVRKFHPSHQGPVQIVVEAICGGSGIVLGRFGVHPERDFSAGGSTEAKHFRFQLEPGACAVRPEAIRVSIVPSLGNGAGASIEVTGRLIDA